MRLSFLWRPGRYDVASGPAIAAGPGTVPLVASAFLCSCVFCPLRITRPEKSVIPAAAAEISTRLLASILWSSSSFPFRVERLHAILPRVPQ